MVSRLVSEARSARRKLILRRPVQWAAGQLRALERLLVDNQWRIVEASVEDLGKPVAEAWMSEVGLVLQEVRIQLKNLHRWRSPRRARLQLSLQPARAWLEPEPLGRVLVVGPFNFPFQLTLAPLAAALAAGNDVVVKPSELAPASSRLLAELLPGYLDREAVSVVEGGPEAVSALLDEPFDHVFFTGGTKAGREVAKRAAERLVPVTLELGGKNPAIVCGGAHIDRAARWILWGRLFNAGQSCVAPDYVLVEQSIAGQFVSAFRRSLASFYPTAESLSANMARIVNSAHFERLVSLVEAGGFKELISVGEPKPRELVFPPTILVGTAPSAACLQEEIFGPILPVVEVAGLEEAISFASDRPRSLVSYVFLGPSLDKRMISRELGSSAVVFNSTMCWFAARDLPFGGVGDSGMGAYHGRWGFETFSHLKAVYDRRGLELWVAYPPYVRLKARLLRLMA